MTKKPSKKLTSVELQADRFIYAANIIHEGKDAPRSWTQVARVFGITENTLRTLRKNAKK